MKLALTLPQTPALMHALPVLDLLVLVLAIPLLSSTFSPQEGMAVDLPETNFRMQRIEQPLIITISMSEKNPQVWIERTRVEEEQIEDLLAQRQTNWEGEGPMPILLRVDKKVSSGFQLEFIDRIKRAGYPKVYLATQSSSQ